MQVPKRAIQKRIGGDVPHPTHLICGAAVRSAMLTRDMESRTKSILLALAAVMVIGCDNGEREHAKTDEFKKSDSPKNITPSAASLESFRSFIDTDSVASKGLIESEARKTAPNAKVAMTVISVDHRKTDSLKYPEVFEAVTRFSMSNGTNPPVLENYRRSQYVVSTSGWREVRRYIKFTADASGQQTLNVEREEPISE